MIQAVRFFDELSQPLDEAGSRRAVDDVVIHADRKAEMLAIDNDIINEDRTNTDSTDGHHQR